MKKLSVMMAVLMGVFGFSMSVSAHVTVSPATSQTESYETYTMKVPNEKDNATTKVVLVVPETANFLNYQPLPGWKVTTTTNKADKIERVTWEKKNEEGGIEQGQFQSFQFVAQNPAETGALEWNAYQYYEDKSIIEWTGDADADTPHSQTTIEQANTKTDAHGKTATVSNHETTPETSQSIGLWFVSGLALLLSLAALVVVIRRK